MKFALRAGIVTPVSMKACLDGFFYYVSVA